MSIGGSNQGAGGSNVHDLISKFDNKSASEPTSDTASEKSSQKIASSMGSVSTYPMTPGMNRSDSIGNKSFQNLRSIFERTPPPLKNPPKAADQGSASSGSQRASTSDDRATTSVDKRGGRVFNGVKLSKALSDLSTTGKQALFSKSAFYILL